MPRHTPKPAATYKGGTYALFGHRKADTILTQSTRAKPPHDPREPVDLLPERRVSPGHVVLPTSARAVIICGFADFLRGILMISYMGLFHTAFV